MDPGDQRRCFQRMAAQFEEVAGDADPLFIQIQYFRPEGQQLPLLAGFRRHDRRFQWKVRLR